MHVPAALLFAFGFLLRFTASESLTDEIFNGEQAQPHSRPYMVSLQHQEQHICGGFLVDKCFVMTAAHCTDPILPLTVLLGAHSLRARKNLLELPVEAYYKHPQYNKKSNENDIMLLKLLKPAINISHVDLIKLPKKDRSIKPGSICEVSGWGYTKSKKMPDKLQVANVTVMDKKQCKRSWKKSLIANVICSKGSETDGGFCEGDSGGPLVCNHVAEGIISYRGGKKCDIPETPNVYIKTGWYLKWIQKILKTSKKTCGQSHSGGTDSSE
ncbi:granzyme-like protein 1 [Erpetoichthys calabaricus]|uniref:granzyme-like protein 1 n=1 Tax=Erpetoichthys calabaricus TaxID=27687 RepID=UPI0022343747|nr:granzyme-like protein 1 [Erpetoichthys calabaricus]